MSEAHVIFWIRNEYKVGSRPPNVKRDLKNAVKNIHPLLDREKQRQAERYEKENRILGLAGLGSTLAALLAFYYTGLSARAASVFSGKGAVWAFLVYGASLLVFVSIVGFPISFLSGYVHEHKWKFSNQTVKSWLLEKVKSLGVSLIILYGVAGLLLWIMASFPRTWWLIAGLAMACISVIFATLFPIVVLPIFNKYTPVENKDLTEALNKILTRGGLKSGGFYKEDMSRQTKKENAFLAGLGKTRRIVLGDTLMDHMSIPEIVSVIAHEVGHYRHKHIWKSLVLGTGQQVVVFFFFSLIARSVFPDFSSSTRWNLVHLPIFVLILGALSGFLFGPLGLALSRKFERQADAYALRNIEDKRDFMTALAGLADRNLSNAYPVRWVKLLYYSHPPIGERLEMADRFRRKTLPGPFPTAPIEI